MLSGRYYWQLLLWCTLYFLLGYLSLWLHDAQDRLSFVWLPAGMAVAAFILTPGRLWLALFIGLFTVQYLLDAVVHHSLNTSLIHSVVSLCDDIAIAWCVRHYSRPGDTLHALIVWLLSTAIISTLAGGLIAIWTTLHHDIAFTRALWIWWSANVSSTVLLTTIIVGLLRNDGRPPLARCVSATVLGLLLCGLTLYIFRQPPSGDKGDVSLFMLACVPVMLMIALPLIGGNKAGALVFTCFSAIVIVCSWQGYGPFFTRGLHAGEPLLLAQIYLSGTALLLSFIYLYNHQARKPTISYFLEPESGRIGWDENSTSALQTQLAAITHRDQLIALLDEEDQGQMRQRWAAVVNDHNTSQPFRFTLHLPGWRHIHIEETTLIRLQRPWGLLLVGQWADEENHAPTPGEG
ncbi:hypothetical protein F9C28_08400 [Shimwellia pseudoproteus]|uniref:MASE1 domain-containing protein n=1 Tax=Shimwellia pseudoproteus TaxID=570012 RepID=UPI0018EC1F62|nr:MASE1 domain-containing protein [Shimwellia pseudoproteus]MBJ3814945.1 hypothetical protein [Shimwellia pseudoproteus]